MQNRAVTPHLRAEAYLESHALLETSCLMKDSKETLPLGELQTRDGEVFSVHSGGRGDLRWSSRSPVSPNASLSPQILKLENTTLELFLAR